MKKTYGGWDQLYEHRRAFNETVGGAVLIIRKLKLRRWSTILLLLKCRYVTQFKACRSFIPPYITRSFFGVERGLWPVFRLRLVRVKWFIEKYFSKNDLRKNILRKKREKKEIKTRKMFSPFQIRKTFYRKMALFSVHHENVFSWPLIFRETNTRKCWKYFPISHFQ